MVKFLVGIVCAAALTFSFGGVVDASHGHNTEGKGHQIKTHGKWAGQLSPGHAKHHTP